MNDPDCIGKQVLPINNVINLKKIQFLLSVDIIITSDMQHRTHR